MAQAGGEACTCRGGIALTTEPVPGPPVPSADQVQPPLARPSGPPAFRYKRYLQQAKESTLSIIEAALVNEGETIPGAFPQSPSTMKSWQALRAGGDFTSDAQIAVSQTHVVVTTRTTLSCWSKDGELLRPPTYIGDFFSPWRRP